MLSTIIVILVAGWVVDRLFFRSAARVEKFKNTERDFGELQHYNKFKLRRNGYTAWYVATDKNLNNMRQAAIEHNEV